MARLNAYPYAKVVEAKAENWSQILVCGFMFCVVHIVIFFFNI